MFSPSIPKLKNDFAKRLLLHGLRKETLTTMSLWLFRISMPSSERHSDCKSIAHFYLYWTKSNQNSHPPLPFTHRTYVMPTTPLRHLLELTVNLELEKTSSCLSQIQLKEKMAEISIKSTSQTTPMSSYHFRQSIVTRRFGERTRISGSLIDGYHLFPKVWLRQAFQEFTRTCENRLLILGLRIAKSSRLQDDFPRGRTSLHVSKPATLTTAIYWIKYMKWRQVCADGNE